MDTEKIAIHFSRHAHDYDRLAVMQRDIADRLLNIIPGKDYRSILDIGCGTGYLCMRLKNRFPSAQVSGIDISKEMIKVARSADPEGNYVCRDFIEPLSPGSKYDLIVSTSALHWADDILQTIDKYRHYCNILAYATFISPSLEELRLAFMDAYRSAGIPYREHVLRFPDKDILPDVVDTAGFHRQYDSWRDVIRSIKAIGGNYTVDSKRPYMNRSIISALDNMHGANLVWRVAFGLIESTQDK